MAEAVAQRTFGAGLPTSPKPPTSLGAGLPAPGIPLPGSCPTGVAYR